MKRCPQCSFLYLDSDSLCDLDHTPLLPDDFGSDLDLAKLENAGHLTRTASVIQRRLNLKTVSAATIVGLIIGLMLLGSYQRTRLTLQASQAPSTQKAQATNESHVSRVIQVAREVSIRAAVAQTESEPSLASASSDQAVPATKTVTTNQPDSKPLRVNSNPVSTGSVTKPGSGSITIRLTDGSTIQADEVWKTKAGIWYRRKGIVTFLKPNRVRAINR
ncbi:MAG TPA: hypothetical protein VFH01_09350 [Pyrinomonadaceae bacterium]|nr:hypothetical protein [Pyrinomonadaceae bacterium]